MPQELAARYVYCVTQAGEEVRLRAVGIEGCEVYAVVVQDLCALVHDCPARPYQSEDPEVAAPWVLAHHQVVEVAWQRWGTVLPLTFNTIIQAEEGRSADENLEAWLAAEYASLKAKLEALAGKAEYGVQLLWDPVLLGKQVAETSAELRTLEEAIQSKPRGMAYLYRQKLEARLRKEVEARAVAACEDLYGRLSRAVAKICVEKTKRSAEGPQMLMNLSCLVSQEQYPEVEATLSQVGDREGLFLRVVGPLPPYSFC